MHETDPDVKNLGFVVPKNKATRVEVHSMNVQLFPKAGKIVDMVILMHCDPKIWFAPSVLINFIFKSVGWKYNLVDGTEVPGKDLQILPRRPHEGMGPADGAESRILRLAPQQRGQLSPKPRTQEVITNRRIYY